MVSHYPERSDLPPVGQSLCPIIWDRDPTPSHWKGLYFLVTVSGLTCLLFFANILRTLLPAWGVDSWDNAHSLAEGNDGLATLMQITLHLSPAQVHAIVWITVAYCLALVGGDTVLGWRKKSTTCTPKNDDVFPWPPSWETDNYLCYHDMFAEPTRFGRLLRRPANTLSNANFLLSSLAVACSLWGSNTTAATNIFWLADAEFAVMLLLLAIFSTLWHASNAPWVQYLDIWSMDCCILYLIIRYVCLGGVCFLHEQSGLSLETAQLTGATSCFVLYTSVIVMLGHSQGNLFQQGYLHGNCHFSSRSRLMGVSNIFGKGHKDVSVGTVCAFAALPVFYLSIPILVLSVIGKFGSVVASRYTFRSLVVGWTYRNFDRWMLDGNPLMNFWVDRKPSPWRTMGAGLFSATAQLHFWTGITLLAAYMHARSVEDGVW